MQTAKQTGKTIVLFYGKYRCHLKIVSTGELNQRLDILCKRGIYNSFSVK